MRYAPVLGLTLIAAAASAQNLRLTEDLNTAINGSTGNCFRTVASTCQMVYDSTNFTNAGVTGPITVTRIKFRAASSYNLAGGQTWSNVSIRGGQCALDYLAVSTVYATNRGAMGPVGVQNLTMGPCTGGWNNDVLVDIDLTTTVPPAVFTYDPSLGDMLFELNFPSAPVPATLIAPVGSTSVAAQKARRINGTLAGPGGAASAFCPVLDISFTGAGGYTAPTGAYLENIGAACGVQAQSFYQTWTYFGDSFDLAGKSLTLIPDNPAAPSSYTVVGGAVAPDLSVTALGAAADSTADDAVINETPGFPINFPGGSTATIGADTNGSVWLNSAGVTDFTPTVAEFLNTLPRFAVVWADNNCGSNLTTHPTSGLYINTDLSGGPGNGVCYVTWKETSHYNGFGTVQNPGTCVNTFQCAIFENGNVELRYGAMNGYESFITPIVGFSRGGTIVSPAVDPYSRNLGTETPLTTFLEVPGTLAMTLTPNIRPVLGTPTGNNLIVSMANLPVTTLIAGVYLDFGVFGPSPALPFSNPGCVQTIISPNQWGLQIGNATPFASPSLPLPLGLSPNGGAWMGATLYCQGVTLDSSNTLFSTNTIKFILGLS